MSYACILCVQSINIHKYSQNNNGRLHSYRKKKSRSTTMSIMLVRRTTTNNQQQVPTQKMQVLPANHARNTKSISSISSGTKAHWTHSRTLFLKSDLECTSSQVTRLYIKRLTRYKHLMSQNAVQLGSSVGFGTKLALHAVIKRLSSRKICSDNAGCWQFAPADSKKTESSQRGYPPQHRKIQNEQTR